MGRKNKLDRSGIFLTLCDHGVAINAVMITGGENWRYAAMCLSRIIDTNVVPRAFYFDINCVWQRYWQRFVVKAAFWGAYVLQAVLAMAFPLPGFHVHMHSAECRSQFALSNERYATDLAGIGEPVEQAWAALGRGPSLRYMSLANHTLAVEAAVQYLNEVNADRLGSLLLGRIKHLSALVLCVENALAQLQPEASQVLLSPRCHCDGALQ